MLNFHDGITDQDVWEKTQTHPYVKTIQSTSTNFAPVTDKIKQTAQRRSPNRLLLFLNLQKIKSKQPCEQHFIKKQNCIELSRLTKGARMSKGAKEHHVDST